MRGNGGGNQETGLIKGVVFAEECRLGCPVFNNYIYI
jgi:hypothetical protein